MIRYIIKRILSMIPVLLGVTLIIFTVLELTPGDPVYQIFGEDLPQEVYEQYREEWGLNGSFFERYGNYVMGVLHGDFGISYVTRQNITQELLSRYPTTIVLALCSTFVAVLIAIPLGVVSAVHQNSFIDSACRLIAMLGTSMPNFLQGILSILIFSVWLNWLPSSGFSSPLHWILPALTIGTHSAASIMRTTRSTMVECIRQDYIRTARAKGASEKVVIWKHALKNTLIPVFTTIGIRFGYGLAGSVITETVFGIPGIGKFLIDSIYARNYPAVQGGVLLIAFAYGMLNLIVDIAYAFIDPRIRSQYVSKQKTFEKKAIAEGGKS